LITIIYHNDGSTTYREESPTAGFKSVTYPADGTPPVTVTIDPHANDELHKRQREEAEEDAFWQSYYAREE